MSCLIQDGTNDIFVDTCPTNYVPVANKAVMAFTTRTTLYLQTLLVFFNGSIAAGLYDPEDIKSRMKRHDSEHEQRKADAQKLDLRRKANMNAFNILISMNIALSCTSLVLAFAPMHTLDFYNGLVATYLLILCWLTIISVAPFYLRLKISIHSGVLRTIIYIQTFLVFVYIFALLGRAKTFGPSFCCNQNVKAYLFHTFVAIGGARTAGIVIATAVLVIFIIHEIIAAKGIIYTKPPKKRSGAHGHTKQPTPVAGRGKRHDSSDLGHKVEEVEEAVVTEIEYVPAGMTTMAKEREESIKGIETDVAKEVTDVERASELESPITPVDEDLQEFIETAGSANLKLFFAYFVIWILVVVNTELLIVRNGFAYDIRDDIKVSMAFPAEFAQTLQFSEVLTFFVPFVHIHDTFQKIRATWFSARNSLRHRRRRRAEARQNRHPHTTQTHRG